MDFHNIVKFVMECRLCLQQGAKDSLSLISSLGYLPGDRKAGKYISLKGDNHLQKIRKKYYFYLGRRPHKHSKNLFCI